MKADSTVFGAFLATVTFLIVAAVLGATFFFTGFAPSIFLLLMFYGWVLYTFIRYRQVRRTELLQVMTASVEAKLPLAPALQAYLDDRPQGGLHEFCIAFLLHIGLFPYYWIWHRGRSFDDRVDELVERLESGETLSQALAGVPAVASHETRVAVAIGEATGQLGSWLRRVDRERLSSVWVDVTPRLVYPLLLILFMLGVISFTMVYNIPKFKKIYEDFKQPLPLPTIWLIQGWMFIQHYMALFVLGIIVIVGAIAGAIFSPTVRWRLPIIGRFYSWDIKGLVLRMLGGLLEMGQTAPEALQVLNQTEGFPRPVHRKLERARVKVEQGEPLADVLHGVGLLPNSMVALVQTAQRTNTLPWALTELGENMASRANQLARRASMIVAPIMIVFVGALVAITVMGMFLPLVHLIEGLAD